MKEAVQNFMDGAIEAIASIRAGFLFAFTGMLAQVTHIWLITKDFSSFEGIGASVQAWILSIFLGGGLLFFTVRAGSAELQSEKNRYNQIANAFAVFEAFINLYYWVNKFVFEPGFQTDGSFNWTAVSWYKLSIAIPFAIAIPVILKQYAGEIKLKKKEDNVDPINSEKLNEMDSQLGIVSRQVETFTEDFKKYFQQMEENYNTLENELEELKEAKDKVPPLADITQLQEDISQMKEQQGSKLPSAKDLPKPKTGKRTN